jgi:ABC-type multidrug transport system ATPase subunit
MGKSRLTGIACPNGSGKTTLIKVLFSLADMDCSRITVNDVDVKRMSRK